MIDGSVSLQTRLAQLFLRGVPESLFGLSKQATASWQARCQAPLTDTFLLGIVNVANVAWVWNHGSRNSEAG